MSPVSSDDSLTSVKRVRLFYGLLALVLMIFGVRLFYVQVIRHGHYEAAALSDQLKQYEIPANRGLISAYDGESTVPIVLNQKLYTVYADPPFVKKPDETAVKLATVLGGSANDYKEKVSRDNTRYVVVAKKVSKQAKEKLLALDMPGIGAQEQNYRTYPQGMMAAHVLGFVNAEGKGIYGIEQALNKELSGTPGALKAITDVHGVPLAANADNISKEPVAGKDVTLTVDVAIQKKVENVIRAAKDNLQAEAVSAIVMNPNNGAVKAMANYPTYDPGNYSDAEDAALYNNRALTQPIEIGSIMKPLTTAAALDQGVIHANQTYNDPARWTVNGYTITNVEQGRAPGVRSIRDILNLSLNTGATWELMQMGGGTINSKARAAWYGYMTDRYRFGQKTGIEANYEATGFVPSPKDNGAGINLTYANTTFGQAMTATTIQAAAAMSAAVNGGTYYQPRLVAGYTDTGGKVTKKPASVLARGVVSPRVSSELIPMMQFTVDNHTFRPKFDQNKYMVGGKTGTAQIAQPGGGYFDNEFNGTYLGFVGGDKPEYVIAVFVTKPKVKAGQYAGSAAAQPIFGEIAHMLIDNSYVQPRH